MSPSLDPFPDANLVIIIQSLFVLYNTLLIPSLVAAFYNLLDEFKSYSPLGLIAINYLDLFDLSVLSVYCYKWFYYH